jgi:hypothetical protein
MTKMQYIKAIRAMTSEERWAGWCDVDKRLTSFVDNPDFDDDSQEYDDLLAEYECWWWGLTDEERRRAERRSTEDILKSVK